MNLIETVVCAQFEYKCFCTDTVVAVVVVIEGTRPCLIVRQGHIQHWQNN
jgi:hypothetical protein